MEMFAAKLGRNFKMKSMVEKFGVETSRTPGSSRVPTLSKPDRSQTPEEKDDLSKFPYREAVGALMWTTTMARPDIASRYAL